MTNRNLLNLFIPVLFVLLALGSTQVNAQGRQSTIMLSGLIIDGDESYGVSGVHIYVKGAGIGTTSNQVGYFGLPVMIGDTILISAVGYKQQQLVVPKTGDAGMTILVDLQTKSTMLPLVEVFPFPTKELFKEAFLALELPDTQLKQLEENLNSERMAALAANMPMSPGANHRFYMNKQINQMSNRYMMPTVSLLNPFAWGEFIKSVKRGDLKKKEN
jgi:hypothetical protein